MLYKRKVKRRDGTVGESRCWWGSYFDHRVGRTVYASTKCGDKKAATLVIHGWERSAADTSDQAAHSAPLRVGIATFKESKKRAGRAKGTLGMHDTKTAHLARLLGDETSMRSITALDVDKYIAKRQDEGAAQGTLHKEVGCLRGLLKLACRHGLAGDPATIMPISFGPGYVPRTTFIADVDQLDALCAHLESGRAAHVRFMVATGARWIESVRATRADVDLVTGLVHLHGTKTDGAQREVPITSIMRHVLDRALTEAPGEQVLFRPWSNVRRDIHQACDKLKIARLSPNDLRRTFGQWHRASGVSPATIGAAMGHADGRMVDRTYGKLPGPQLRDAMRRESGSVLADARRQSGTMLTLTPMTIAVAPVFVGFVVPGGGIEPSTRGFSSRFPFGVSAEEKPPKRQTWPPDDRPLHVAPTVDALLAFIAELASMAWGRR